MLFEEKNLYLSNYRSQRELPCLEDASCYRSALWIPREWYFFGLSDCDDDADSDGHAWAQLSPTE